jgi:hypothetical protein
MKRKPNKTSNMKAINLTINVVFVGMVAMAIAFAMYKLISGAPVGTFCGMG